MYSGPDTQYHSDEACTEKVKCTTSNRTRLPMNSVISIAEKQRALFDTLALGNMFLRLPLSLTGIKELRS